MQNQAIADRLREAAELLERQAADPDAVTITVEDTGPGLPDALLERVFEPFFRAEASRSPETGGSGLGLAIARAIIRGHGGDLTLANRPTGGLVATIDLPAAARPVVDI